MVKPGAVCVDVGITRTAAGLVGDLDPAVRDVAGWVAPVPGGVGPMTRAMLLSNVVELAEQLLTTSRLMPRHEASAAARSLRHWPLLVVVVGVVAGLVIAFVAESSWRLGCLVIGASLGVGAVERIALPSREAGLLQVRSKAFDVAVLILGGAAIVVLAIVVPAGVDRSGRVPRRRPGGGGGDAEDDDQRDDVEHDEHDVDDREHLAEHPADPDLRLVAVRAPEAAISRSVLLPRYQAIGAHTATKIPMMPSTKIIVPWGCSWVGAPYGWPYGWP